MIKNLEFKVGLLLALTAFLAAAFVAYVLHARGVFEHTQRLTLIVDNAEGVNIGMPLNFSGFPIGRVKRLTLRDDGQVRIEVAIPADEARWLRDTSVFTLEKPLVGGAKLRAFTTDFQAAPLKDGAERRIYMGDAGEDIPAILNKVKAILANIEGMTRADSSLNQSLAHVKTLTGRMAGDYGVLGGLLGDDAKARQVVEAIERANALLGSLNGLALKLDQRAFGPAGLMDKADQSITQVNAILQEVRISLKKADTILANAETISANAKTASTDLGQLRSEIDESVRKLNQLINEINRKWPFAREAEVKLP